MKKFSIFSIVFSFFLFNLSPEENISLLRIPEPGTALIKKSRVLITLSDVKKIIGKSALGSRELNVELATSGDFVIARIAKMKNGRISYMHKIIDNDYLLVSFGKDDYKELLRKILHQPGALNYQLIFSDKRNKVIKSFPLTLSKLPDLQISLKYPVNIFPGDSIGNKISVVVKNIGMEASVETEAEILLSKKFNIPSDFRKALKSGDIIRFADGIVKIPILQSGEEKIVKPSNKLTVPTDIPEGKYYIASIIDPGNDLLELDERNNFFEGFVIIETLEPKKITVLLPDTELIYYPANFKLEIRSNGLIISSGKEWRKCNIKPYIYQIKHANWINFFWEIDTLERSVWKITGAKFCKRGGSEKRVVAKVINFGGTKTIPPGKFKLLLKDTKLIYGPKLKHFSIISNKVQIGHPSFWQVYKQKPLKYHFKFTTWDTVFLELDPLKKLLKKYRWDSCVEKPIRENLQISKSI